MKKTLILFLSFLLILFANMAFLFSSNASETLATNTHGETYKTYVFSTENHISETMDIAFTSNSDYSNPTNRTHMVKVNDYMFEAYVPSSISEDYVIFYGDNYTKNVSYRNATSILSTYSRSGYISGDFGTSFRYLSSGYTTRRMWFKLDDMLDNYYPVLFSDGLRFIMNKIHNYIDGSDYYFVDVPLGITNFYIVEYLYDGSNTRISSSQFFTNNIETREVMYLSFNNKNTISNISMIGCDQYIINEYLKGFSTCLDNSINGSGAFTSFVKPFVDKFVSYQGGTLLDVYQDDYLPTDYDEGYIDTSIRGGNLISAQEKYNALMSNTLTLRMFTSLTSFGDTKIVIISIFISISIFPIAGYFIYKRHQRSS